MTASGREYKTTCAVKEGGRIVTTVHITEDTTLVLTIDSKDLHLDEIADRLEEVLNHADDLIGNVMDEFLDKFERGELGG